MPWADRPPKDGASDARVAFGRGIRALRLYHGWTQQELEDRSLLDQTIISRIETGRPIPLRFKRVLELLDALGVDRIAFKTRWEGSTVEAFMTRGRRDFDALGPERRWRGKRPAWADPEDPVDPIEEDEADDEADRPGSSWVENGDGSGQGDRNGDGDGDRDDDRDEDRERGFGQPDDLNDGLLDGPGTEVVRRSPR